MFPRTGDDPCTVQFEFLDSFSLLYFLIVSLTERFLRHLLPFLLDSQASCKRFVISFPYSSHR